MYWDEWWTLGFSIHHAFHVSKSIAKLLKFTFACVCPQKDFYQNCLSELNCLWTQPSYTGFFHRPIVYLWKTNWQFIILQLLKSLTLTVPQMRDYALQINLNSLTAFVDLPHEPVATSLFPFVKTAFFLPTGMENGRHPVAPGWWRHCAAPWQSLPAGSSEFSTSPGPGLFPERDLQRDLPPHSSRAGVLVHLLVVRRALVLSPPGWSSPQLFVSVDQIWVRRAVFTWSLCRWCLACSWPLRQNVETSEAGCWL